MFKRIVLVYDGSDFDAIALQRGSELAHVCQADLHLLGIVATTGYMGLAEGTSGVDVWGLERANLQPALEIAVQELSAQGVKATAIIREGDPAAQIVTYARETEADLIVIGHTGKGMFARLFEASVGIKILNDLPCNLLIVR